LQEQEQAAPPAGLKNIEILAGTFLGALASLESSGVVGEIRVLNVRNGIDFYAEVSRFEASLIAEALSVVSGSRARAARLLRLKQNTLYSKIKAYGLNS
jgi:DNA-binding NtrC family response regulator